MTERKMRHGSHKLWLKGHVICLKILWVIISILGNMIKKRKEEIVIIDYRRHSASKVQEISPRRI